MSLRATYNRFLAAPSTGALANDATLHYITTLTSLQDATAIIKHLSVQEKLLKKKDQKIISAVEGNSALSLDVETTIEFLNGGGAYLPGLDDNFVADRTVTFPMVHMVHFDNAGKITQIRLYWDQGALLKQIEVIGARARNWPIRESQEQLKLIASSTKAFQQQDSEPSTRRSTNASRGTDEVSVTSRSRGSTQNAMNDPHASLALFAPRNVDEDAAHAQRPIAPRVASAKPPPREYSELFVGENPGSPSPNERIPVKGGASKNYKDSRLFDEETEAERVAATPSIKTNPKKFGHFEFGDGEEAKANSNRSRSRGRHQSNWDFEDFVTPNKPKSKTQPQAVRHFGWSDDEEEGSPVRRQVVHKARPDADPHFEFVDDGTPDADRKQISTKGRAANKGMGLYSDHVTGTTAGAEESPYDDDKRPLSNVTNQIKNENRKKDFGHATWEIADDSPAATKNGAQKKVVIDEHQATKSNWSLYTDSPDQRGGINIAGNGMGNRSGTQFSLYDQPASPEKKENTSTNYKVAGAGIKTQGDGMGGKKGADSFWDF